MQKVKLDQIPNIRFSLDQTPRPQTTQKTISKNQSSSSVFPSFPEDYIIQKLKRVLPSNPKQHNNSLKSGPNRSQIYVKNIVNTTNRMAYQRGLKVERTYYNSLLEQLSELQNTIPQINNLNTSQMFAYKQKYLNEYLLVFFKKIGQECYEKSQFVMKLWAIVRGIFEQLIKRLIKQLNMNQRKLLKQCLNTHETYQEKFNKYQEQIQTKNEQIDFYKGIISKISIKNRKKCRKNREIAHGIVQMVGRLSSVQKQRNRLQNQYINMLTLGYEGGMQYQEAKKFTLDKFGIEKQLDIQQQGQKQNKIIQKVNKSKQKNKDKQNLRKNSKPTQKNSYEQIFQVSNIQNYDEFQQNHLKFKKKFPQRKTFKRFTAIQPNRQQHDSSQEKSRRNKKLYKAKQKYMYGSNRLVFHDDEAESQQDEFIINLTKNYGKNRSHLRKGSNKSSKKSVFQNMSQIQQVDQKKIDLKQYVNKKVQTMQYTELQNKVQKQCATTDLCNQQKYKDRLIQNKEIQTQIFRSNKNNFHLINCSSQYNKYDFTEGQTQEIKTKILKRKQSRFSLDYEKTIESKSQIEEQNSSNLNSNDKIVQTNQIQQISREHSQQSIPSVVIQKKNKSTKLRKNSRQSKSKNFTFTPNVNNIKKGSRPSVFKRASVMVTSTQSNLKNRQQLNKNIIQIQRFKTNTNTNISSKNKKEQTQLKNQTQSNDVATFSSNSSQRNMQNFQDQTDYHRTDMISVLENMSKLTPQGIYIDETMLFLLKKSLFKIKHENCNNILKKNSKLLNKIRQEVSAMGNVKSQVLMSLKGVSKIVGSVYDIAFNQLAKYDKIQSILPLIMKKNQNNSNESQIQNFTRSPPIKINKQINLLQILQKCIQKQYPMYKIQQIEHKMVKITKSIEYQSCQNYMIKNFMLLSCLDDNIFSPVIFSNDIQFYFYLLIELKTDSSKQSENSSINSRMMKTISPGKGFKQSRNKNKSVSYNNKENKDSFLSAITNIKQQNINDFEALWNEKQQKVYKISNNNGSYENCCTTNKKLRQILPKILCKFYKKQSLLTFTQKRIQDTLQKIQQSISNNDTIIRLDIFKCCQLIMQSIFSFKLDILKSYAQLTQITTISVNGNINQELLMQILDFRAISKLQKLNTINKFRYDYGKQNTIQGVSLIKMVNFCLNHNIFDFDQILYDVIRKYPINQQISMKIYNLKNITKKYLKLGKLCMYLHHKNINVGINNNSNVHLVKQKKRSYKQNLIQKAQINQQNEMLILQQKQPQNQGLVNQQGESIEDNLSVCSNIIQQNCAQNIVPKRKKYNTQAQTQEQQQSENNQTFTSLNNQSFLTNNMIFKKQSLQTKQLWQIIGVQGSNSLIHCKVVEIESSQLLEQILGQDLVALYLASLCQLQQKKYTNKISKNQIKINRNQSINKKESQFI